MKKFLMIAAMAVCTMFANAQEAGQVRFGVTGGVNFAGMTDADGTKTRTSFHAGVKAEYNLSEDMYLNAAALYTSKGCKAGDESMNLDYVAIPLNFGYRMNVSDGFKLFGEVGPYFDVKVGGHKAVKDAMKGLEMGAGVAVGAEFSNIQVKAGYELGLTKAFKEGDSKNNNIYIGVAYMF